MIKAFLIIMILGYSSVMNGSSDNKEFFLSKIPRTTYSFMMSHRTPICYVAALIMAIALAREINIHSKLLFTQKQLEIPPSAHALMKLIQNEKVRIEKIETESKIKPSNNSAIEPKQQIKDIEEFLKENQNLYDNEKGKFYEILKQLTVEFFNSNNTDDYNEIDILPLPDSDDLFVETDHFLMISHALEENNFIILYGPSGTGKTKIISHIAKCHDGLLYDVKYNHVADDSVINTILKFNKIYAFIKKLRQSKKKIFIRIDECDVFFSQHCFITNAISQVFIECLHEMQNQQIYIIGTTNHLNNLNLPNNKISWQWYEISYPEEKSRQSFLTSLIDKTDILFESPGTKYNLIGKITENTHLWTYLEMGNAIRQINIMLKNTNDPSINVESLIPTNFTYQKIVDAKKNYEDSKSDKSIAKKGGVWIKKNEENQWVIANTTDFWYFLDLFNSYSPDKGLLRKRSNPDSLMWFIQEKNLDEDGDQRDFRGRSFNMVGDLKILQPNEANNHLN